MNRSQSTVGAISVIGMLVVLGIAGGLDVLLTHLGKVSAQSFSPLYVLPWAYSLSFLLMAALLLLLFWYVITQAPRNGWVAALYLVVGLFFAFYLQLYFWPPVGERMPVFLTTMALSISMLTIRAGSFIASMGLFMLILPRR